MGGTGVEPNVHGVSFFVEGAAATFTLDIVGQDFGGIQLKPGVRAALTEQLGDNLNRPLVHQRLAAVLTEENRDGHAPDTLAGNAPVGALHNH